MRKVMLNGAPGTSPEQGRLTVESIDEVQVSSEAPGRPIENVFSDNTADGWLAGTPGDQIIRLLFERPQTIRRIVLKFVERQQPRTQEFVIAWSMDTASATSSILRQQWTFNPAGSVTEYEDYQVELENVCVLELRIRPDLSGPGALASLAHWGIYRTR